MNALIKWTATCITLAGAICTSLQYTPENIYLFNIASCLYLVWGIRINEKSIVALNLGLLTIYAFGLLLI